MWKMASWSSPSVVESNHNNNNNNNSITINANTGAANSSKNHHHSVHWDNNSSCSGGSGFGDNESMAYLSALQEMPQSEYGDGMNAGRNAYICCNNDNTYTAATDATTTKQNGVSDHDKTATTTTPTKATGTSPLSEYTAKEYRYMVSAGMLLSFNSGFISGTCLTGDLIIHRQAVSGFTNLYSRSALFLAMGDELESKFLACMIASYTLGAFLAGFFSPKAAAYRLYPTYSPTFFVGSVFLTLGSLMAALDDTDRRGYYLVAAANGIQCGIASQYTANLIRATFTTGTATDIGLYAAQCVRGNYKNQWRLQVLVGIGIVFWFGSLASKYVAQALTSYTLFVSAALFFSLGMSLVVFLMKNLDVSFTQALFGTWNWKKVLDKLVVMDGENGTITKERALEAFDKMDRDGSGQIDAKELFLALREVGVSSITEDAVKMMITIIDEDGNGEIDKEEWLRLVIGKKHKQQ